VVSVLLSAQPDAAATLSTTKRSVADVLRTTRGCRDLSTRGHGNLLSVCHILLMILMLMVRLCIRLSGELLFNLCICLTEWRLADWEWDEKDCCANCFDMVYVYAK
jgi:hypothetical protein